MTCIYSYILLRNSLNKLLLLLPRFRFLSFLMSMEEITKQKEIGEPNSRDTGSATATCSSLKDSTASISSSSSSESVENACSSTLRSSSSSPTRLVPKGPLYEFSELMIQLPIKRGLSKYYQGKSQSFTSLSSVKSIEDLAKRENHCKKKMKTCTS